jgi:hypothetical protein
MTTGSLVVYDKSRENDLNIAVHTPDVEKDQLLPKTDPKPCTSILWSKENDMYFSLTSQEIRINLFRACVKVVLIFVFFALYYLLWNWYAMITFIIAIASCTLSCLGMPFLCPSCYAGLLVSLLHGIRIGNELIHVDIKWSA